LRRILFTSLRWLAALIVVTTFGSRIGLADEWTAYRMGDVTFEAPADWTVARRQGDRAFILQSPKRDLELRVEWWFQDEPILGYDDIKSHKRIAVAGKPATYIHSVFADRQSLKAVLDEKRLDGRKLLVVLEATTPDLSAISPLFDELLGRVRFGKSNAASPDRPPPLSPQMRAVAGHVADDCEAIAPATWNHPTLVVIRKRKQAHLEWVMLCRKRSYPVYGINFDYDPQGRTKDFFSPLYDEMLSQNQGAPFSFAVLRDKLIVDVTRPVKDGVSVDIRQLPDLDVAPADRGAATPPGVEAKPDSRQVAAPAAQPYLPAPEDTEVRVWLGPVSFEPPSGWLLRPDDSGRLMAMVRPEPGAEILVMLWPAERPMPATGIARIEHVVIAGAPATRLLERSGQIDIDHIFFEEPFVDGSRLSVAYRAAGEPLEDGAPLLELVLASLDRRRPAPAGPPLMSREFVRAVDPFANLDASELQSRK
jgi:hypothetical protein